MGLGYGLPRCRVFVKPPLNNLVDDIAFYEALRMSKLYISKALFVPMSTLELVVGPPSMDMV